MTAWKLPVIVVALVAPIVAGFYVGGPGVGVAVGALAAVALLVVAARQRAQQHLVATVAALAKAGIVAEARVGDEDVVQAVEDQLQTFPATEVILIVGDGEEAEAAAAASAELESRLRPEFHRLVVGES